MLDLKYIRTHLDEVRQALARRRAKVDLDAFMALDERRRALIPEALRPYMGGLEIIKPE